MKNGSTSAEQEYFAAEADHRTGFGHIRSIHEVLNGATITFGDGKTQVVHESPMSILKKLENYKLPG